MDRMPRRTGMRGSCQHKRRVCQVSILLFIFKCAIRYRMWGIADDIHLLVYLSSLLRVKGFYLTCWHWGEVVETKSAVWFSYAKMPHDVLEIVKHRHLSSRSKKTHVSIKTIFVNLFSAWLITRSFASVSHHIFNVISCFRFSP